MEAGPYSGIDPTGFGNGGAESADASMIPVLSGVRVWLAVSLSDSDAHQINYHHASQMPGEARAVYDISTRPNQFRPIDDQGRVLMRNTTSHRRSERGKNKVFYTENRSI